MNEDFSSMDRLRAIETGGASIEIEAEVERLRAVETAAREVNEWVRDARKVFADSLIEGAYVLRPETLHALRDALAITNPAASDEEGLADAYRFSNEQIAEALDEALLEHTREPRTSVWGSFWDRLTEGGPVPVRLSDPADSVLEGE